MTAVTDFIMDLRDNIDPTNAIRINAVNADISPAGEGISVAINDAFADLAFGGQHVITPISFQIDIYASSYARLTQLKNNIFERYHGKAMIIGTTTYRRMAVTFSTETASSLNNTIYRAIVTLEGRT